MAGVVVSCHSPRHVVPRHFVSPVIELVSAAVPTRIVCLFQGLQRDVSTLLDFRDSLMSRSLGPSTSPLPVPGPAGSASQPTQATTALPSSPTEPASAANSSGIGTSTTSTTGTSTTGTASTSGVTTGAGGTSSVGGGAESGASAAICGAESGAGAAAYRSTARDGDELMSLLEAIETQGRHLVQQTRRGEADIASGSSLVAENTEGNMRKEPESPAPAVAGARQRCVNCDRTEGHGRGVSSNPGAGSGFGARRRPVERRRPSEVRLLEETGDELPDWTPGWDRYVQTLGTDSSALMDWVRQKLLFVRHIDASVLSSHFTHQCSLFG